LPWLSNPPACQPKSDQKTTKQVSVKRPPPQDSDSEARKLKALEEENQKLKKLLSESMLDVSTLRKMLGKNF
jgi:hypothetical protein